MRAIVKIEEPGDYPGSVEVWVVQDDTLHPSDWKVLATIEYHQSYRFGKPAVVVNGKVVHT